MLPMQLTSYKDQESSMTIEKKEKIITYSVAKKRRVLRGLIDVNRLNLLFLPSPELIKTGVEGARVLF
jgi:hypothetical protein